MSSTAEDPQLDRAVAVKHLSNRIAADPQMRFRFNEEGRALVRLNHLHIVTVHEYADEEVTVDAGSTPERVCALVLEYLPGGTLTQRFRRTGLTMEQWLCRAGTSRLSRQVSAVPCSVRPPPRPRRLQAAHEPEPEADPNCRSDPDR